MGLPRGATGQLETAPAATAQWASPAEISSRAYKPGAIYLGMLPHAAAEARPPLDRLAVFERALADAADLKRPENAAWLAEKRRLLQMHRALLETTALSPIGVLDDRHILTVAGSRAGKGVSGIVPNLCWWPGSLVVIDPKGENARLTAARRGPGSACCEGLGQDIAVLDPFRVSGVDAALLGAWNPLHGLDEHHEALIDRASSIAGALVVPGRGEDGHWDESARQLVKALILLVVLHYEPAQRTLLTVHALLMRGVQDQPELGWDSVPSGPDDPTPMQLLLASMQMEQRLDGLVAGAANTLIDMGERERGSVLSTARRNLEWLERPAMRRVVERSTFDLDALKGAQAAFSLFLCLPPQRMADCGRWLRLVITAALESCYASSEPPQSGHPVLFLLEEFPVLKHMEIIETAAGYAAGFGVKLWIIVQDLTQLKRHYKESWETFIGNAGVIQAFGNSDQTTLDYLSKRLGQVEVSQSVTNTTTSLSASSNDPGEFQTVASLFQSRGPASLLTNPLLLAFNQQSTGQSATTSTAMNQQIIRTPLILADEIERQFRREAMNQIVSVKGFAPFVLARVTYHEAPEFLGLYEPDREPRYTREAAAAERTRRLEARRVRCAGLIEAADRFVSKANQEIEAARARKR